MDAEKSAAQITEFLELLQRTQKLATVVQTKTVENAGGDDFSMLDPGSIGAAYLRVLTEMAKQPYAITAFAQDIWFGAAQAWLHSWSSDGTGVADRRFRDKTWEADPASRGLRDIHLALEAAAGRFLETLPEGSKDSLRVKFYTRQILSALSPSNFLALNPAARNRLMETEGQSLLDGFRNLVEDLEKGEGRLDITMTDKEAFVVGRDLATTPGKVVYQNDLMQLIQYEPLTETQRRRPLLFVPAWINKFYIMDMRPENSLVRYMLERGHSVFMISWVNPAKEHAQMGFEDYMRLGPIAALDAIQAATGEDKINILGFCIGGILVTATLAWLAARKDTRVASATTLATMVDFTDVGEIGVFVDRDRLAALRKHVNDTGFLEDYHLKEMFSMIRENDLVWSFHVMNYLMGRKPPPFDLLYWNSDSTRLPAAMLLWYLEKIYLENGLRKPGHLSLDGTPIDIHKIRIPCFILATKEDHIAPWVSVYPTTQLLGGKSRFVLGASGHIAGVINPPADRPKYGYWTSDTYPDNAEAWLEGAQYTEGSWWPCWAEWLEAKDRRKQVPARHPGDRDLQVIEDAPGSYVLAQ